jgi:outer membrane protein TolC
VTPLLLLLTFGALAREVTLDEALDLAVMGNPENVVASWEVTAARSRSHQVRSYYLPTVTVQGATLWWDGPLEAQIFEGNPCENLEDAFKGICESMLQDFDEPLLLRKAATQQVGVSAAVPITGLVGVHQGHRATRALTRAAERDEEAKRSEVALSVVEAWFQALEVRKLAAVAEQAVEMLEAHGVRAGAFYEAGLIGRSDVLRLEVALTEAKLDLRRAKAGVELTERALAIFAGAEEERLSPLDVDLSTLPPLDVPADAMAVLAENRPGVAAMHEKTLAARAGRDAARADMVPQVAGIASFTKNWGLGTMSAEEELYLGFGLQWEVLGWGRRHAAVREASAQVYQAETGLEGMRRGAVLEARAALVEAELSRAAWEAARVSTEQAEENARIVRARYDHQTASTTDLLEAETLLTKARTDEIVSAFAYLVAVAATQQTLGVPIEPLEGLVVASPVE